MAHPPWTPRMTPTIAEPRRQSNPRAHSYEEDRADVRAVVGARGVRDDARTAPAAEPDPLRAARLCVDARGLPAHLVRDPFLSRQRGRRQRALRPGVRRG